MIAAALIAAALAGAYAWSRWFEWRHAFRPDRTLEGDPSSAGLAYETVEFMAADGCRLHGWWIPHPAARGTILYCHGNAGNIGTRVDLAARLHGLGVNVLLFDYRGYGKSRGIPGERGLYLDAAAAYEVARARHGDAEIPPVLVYGASLGGPVAAEVAATKPVAGLVLECTFTSAIELGRIWYPRLPVGLIARYRFDTLGKLASVRAPVLVAHSPEDRLIPFALGKALFEAAGEPKTFVVLQGDHDEAGWNASPGYWSSLEGFVDRCLARPRDASGV